MKPNQVLYFAIILSLATTAITSTTITTTITLTQNNSQSQSFTKAQACSDTEFRSFKFPEDRNDAVTICQNCNCGTPDVSELVPSKCSNYIGCTGCESPDLFLLEQQPQFPARSYNNCLKCDLNCEAGYCKHQLGCVKCQPSYKTKAISNHKGALYNVCTPFDSKKEKKEDNGHSETLPAIRLLVLIGISLGILTIGTFIYCSVSSDTRNLSKLKDTSTSSNHFTLESWDGQCGSPCKKSSSEISEDEYQSA